VTECGECDFAHAGNSPFSSVIAFSDGKCSRVPIAIGSALAGITIGMGFGIWNLGFGIYTLEFGTWDLPHGNFNFFFLIFDLC
jgi:hypothetical protein